MIARPAFLLLLLCLACATGLAVMPPSARAQTLPLDPAFPAWAGMPADGTLIRFANDPGYYLVYRYRKLHVDRRLIYGGCGLEAQPVYDVTFSRDRLPDGPAIADAATCLARVTAAGKPPGPPCEEISYSRFQLRVARRLQNSVHGLEQLIANDIKNIRVLAPDCPVQTRLDDGETPYDILLSGVAEKFLLAALYQGGLIAAVGADGGGIAAAPQDLPNTAYWFNIGFGHNTIATGATGTAIGTGRANTAAIVKTMGPPKRQTTSAINYAAYAATMQSYGGFTDWYLPSLGELQAVLQNVFTPQACVNGSSGSGGNYPVGAYWSSTEYDAQEAYWVNCWDYQPDPPSCGVHSDNTWPPCFSTKGMAQNLRVVRSYTSLLPVVTDVMPGDGQVTMHFETPAIAGASPVTGYTVTAVPGGAGTGSGISVASQTSPVTVTGLTNGVAYTLTVTAADAAGTQAISAPSRPVVPRNEFPAPLLYATALTPTGSTGILAYTVDPATGALTPVGGSPFVQPFGANQLAIDPLGTYVYVSCAHLDCPGLATYTIASGTGVLTPVPNASTKLGDEIAAMVINPAGDFLYAGAGIGYKDGDEYVFKVTTNIGRIDRATGLLTPVHAPSYPYPVSVGRAEFAMAPSGKYLYAVEILRYRPPGIYGYALDADTGLATPLPGSPFAMAGAPDIMAITMHPSGRFLFVNTSYPKAIWAFAVDQATGALSPAPGSPLPQSGSVSVMASSANYLYAGTTLDAGKTLRVGVYSIDPATGKLTAAPGSPLDLSGNWLSNPTFLKVNARGTFLVVGQYSRYYPEPPARMPGRISAYPVNPVTGLLWGKAGTGLPGGKAGSTVTLDFGPFDIDILE